MCWNNFNTMCQYCISNEHYNLHLVLKLFQQVPCNVGKYLNSINWLLLVHDLAWKKKIWRGAWILKQIPTFPRYTAQYLILWLHNISYKWLHCKSSLSMPQFKSSLTYYYHNAWVILVKHPLLLPLPLWSSRGTVPIALARADSNKDDVTGWCLELPALCLVNWEAWILSSFAATSSACAITLERITKVLKQ